MAAFDTDGNLMVLDATDTKGMFLITNAHEQLPTNLITFQIILGTEISFCERLRLPGNARKSER